MRAPRTSRLSFTANVSEDRRPGPVFPDRDEVDVDARSASCTRDTVAASQWSTKQPPSPNRGITEPEASSSRATARARETPRPAVEAETPSRRVRVDLARGPRARAASARAEAEDIAGAGDCV